MDNIPYNDKSVFECISQGKCAGIFQLESGGMRNFMKELKPDCLEDLIAGISLYRPGPDRKSDVWGKSVELGGRRIIKK